MFSDEEVVRIGYIDFDLICSEEQSNAMKLASREQFVIASKHDSGEIRPVEQDEAVIGRQSREGVVRCRKVINHTISSRFTDNKNPNAAFATPCPKKDTIRIWNREPGMRSTSYVGYWSLRRLPILLMTF